MTMVKLSQCLGPGCTHGESNPKSKLQICSQCQVAKYCSSACQRSDWKRHKAEWLEFQDLHASHCIKKLKTDNPCQPAEFRLMAKYCERNTAMFMHERNARCKEYVTYWKHSELV
eukprot:scaffold59410_cov66-Attheya_sp.AAC.3